MTVIPHPATAGRPKLHRAVELARPGLAVVAIDEATALIPLPDGTWRVEGASNVTVYRDGHPADLADLPSLLRPEPAWQVDPRANARNVDPLGLGSPSRRCAPS